MDPVPEGRERSHSRQSAARWLASLSAPVVAAAVQWIFWPHLQPLVWFPFYVAVFACAWIDGRRGAITCSVLSAALVVYLFVPPQFSFAIDWRVSNLSGWLSIVVFLLMGVAFGETQERLKRAEAARFAKIEQFYEATLATERDRTTAAVKDSESRFQQIVEGLPQLVWTCRAEGPCDYLSRQWIEYTGVPLERQLGSGWVDAIHPDDRAALVGAWSAAVARGEAFRFEHRLRRVDGHYRWFEARAVPLRDADGRIVRWFGASTDAQETRDARTELARQARLIELAYDPIIAWSEDTGIVYWNRGAELLYGYSAQEAVGRDSHELLRTQFPVSKQETLDVLARDGMWAGELRHVTRDGRRQVIVQSRLQVIDSGGRRLVLEANRDITAEREQLEQVRRWADAFTYCRHGIAIGDPDTNSVLACNPAFAQLVRRPAGEVVGQPIVSVYVPEDRELVRRQIAAADATGAARYETRMARKGTTSVPVQVDLASVRDESGRVMYRVATVQDIHERRAAEAEVRALTANLEQKVAERTSELNAANAELESFAYAVSHDLRAPLRAMSGFSAALIEDHSSRLDGEARVYLDQIIRGARQMGELIDGLLTLSRSTRGELTFQPVDLSAMAEELWPRILLSNPARAVAFEVEPGLVGRGDPRLLKVVLQNLLENAWKYTGQTADPRVRFFAVPGRPGTFCVEDNGAGFDRAHAGRLFQPFQRLHRQEEFAGLGIGLATVLRIVRRHGGTLQAEGEVGGGARFTFSLPVAAVGRLHDER